MKEENKKKVNLDEIARLVVEHLGLHKARDIIIEMENENGLDIRIIVEFKEVHEMLLRKIEHIDLLHGTYNQFSPKFREINNSNTDVVYVVFICSDLKIFRDIKNRMRHNTEVKFHREETQFTIGFFVGYLDGKEIKRFETIKKNR